MRWNRCIHLCRRCTCPQQDHPSHLLSWRQCRLTHFWPVLLDSYSLSRGTFLDLSSGEKNLNNRLRVRRHYHTISTFCFPVCKENIPRIYLNFINFLESCSSSCKVSREWLATFESTIDQTTEALPLALKQ